MANLLYLSGPATRRYSRRDLETVAGRITPENAPDETRIVRDGDTVVCLVGDTTTLPVDGTSVCMGQLQSGSSGWSTPGADVPDGNYAIVRDSPEAVELVSDVVGSRSLFYRLFDDMLVAATSQRAVMHFADSFEFERRVIPWMVSSGTLGHHQVWDRRLELVPPDSRVRLDRETWTLDVRDTSPPSSGDQRGRDGTNQFAAALGSSCDGFGIDPSDWTLPLSGGLDSRALLLEYQDADGIDTVTWGTASALDDPDSDAVVAKELAAACDVPHSYHTLPTAPEDVETVFERFLTAGEGRIDHVGGYLDGFETFASLHRNGTRGIVRGDVAQSETVVKSDEHGRVNVGARLLSDYADLPSLDVPAGDRQRWPDRFQRRDGETLATYRDRVYRRYRIPYVLAPLSDLKLPYVEIVNPLLTRDVVETVRRLPDEARTGKRHVHEYLDDAGPDIRVATAGATPSYADVFGAPRTVEYLKRELDTERTRELLGTELTEWTLSEMGATTAAGEGDAPAGAEWTSALDALKFSVANSLPTSLTRRLAARLPVDPPAVSIDPNHLAFRLYIIVSMVDRIEDDIEALGRRAPAPSGR